MCTYHQINKHISRILDSKEIEIEIEHILCLKRYRPNISNEAAYSKAQMNFQIFASKIYSA